MKTSDFKHGDLVTYIPNHACGNKNHKDCKKGVISSVNKRFVFVKYDNAVMTMITGDEPHTAQATRIEDLIKRIRR